MLSPSAWKAEACEHDPNDAERGAFTRQPEGPVARRLGGGEGRAGRFSPIRSGFGRSASAACGRNRGLKPVDEKPDRIGLEIAGHRSPAVKRPG